jgi:hypothetical protein
MEAGEKGGGGEEVEMEKVTRGIEWVAAAAHLRSRRQVKAPGAESAKRAYDEGTDDVPHRPRYPSAPQAERQEEAWNRA